MSYQYHGQTALITGASSGIGAAFATALASRGTDLILVARSAATLESRARDLHNRYGVQATAIPVDLEEPHAVQVITARMQALSLRCDLLINNAGFGSYGAFETVDPARDRALVLVNVAALVELSHAVVPQMLARGTGAIINVASTAAFQPMPYMATYAATKAFVLSFSEALGAEYRTRGVQVVALCPGPTETGFFTALNNAVVDTQPFLSRRADVAQVVATGLRALERRQRVAVVGRTNTLLAVLPRLLPRTWIVAATARMLHVPVAER